MSDVSTFARFMASPLYTTIWSVCTHKLAHI